MAPIPPAPLNIKPSAPPSIPPLVTNADEFALIIVALLVVLCGVFIILLDVWARYGVRYEGVIGRRRRRTRIGGVVDEYTSLVDGADSGDDEDNGDDNGDEDADGAGDGSSDGDEGGDDEDGDGDESGDGDNKDGNGGDDNGLGHADDAGAHNDDGGGDDAGGALGGGPATLDGARSRFPYGPRTEQRRPAAVDHAGLNQTGEESSVLKANASAGVEAGNATSHGSIPAAEAMKDLINLHGGPEYISPFLEDYDESAATPERKGNEGSVTTSPHVRLTDFDLEADIQAQIKSLDRSGDSRTLPMSNWIGHGDQSPAAVSHSDSPPDDQVDADLRLQNAVYNCDGNPDVQQAGSKTTYTSLKHWGWNQLPTGLRGGATDDLVNDSGSDQSSQYATRRSLGYHHKVDGASISIPEEYMTSKTLTLLDKQSAELTTSMGSKSYLLAKPSTDTGELQPSGYAETEVLSIVERVKTGWRQIDSDGKCIKQDTRASSSSIGFVDVPASVDHFVKADSVEQIEVLQENGIFRSRTGASIQTHGLGYSQPKDSNENSLQGKRQQDVFHGYESLETTHTSDEGLTARANAFDPEEVVYDPITSITAAFHDWSLDSEESRNVMAADLEASEAITRQSECEDSTQFSRLDIAFASTLERDIGMVNERNEVAIPQEEDKPAKSGSIHSSVSEAASSIFDDSAEDMVPQASQTEGVTTEGVTAAQYGGPNDICRYFFDDLRRVGDAREVSEHQGVNIDDAWTSGNADSDEDGSFGSAPGSNKDFDVDESYEVQAAYLPRIEFEFAHEAPPQDDGTRRLSSIAEGEGEDSSPDDMGYQDLEVEFEDGYA